MPLKIRWLGTACFEILLPDGKTVIIDPYVDDAVSAPMPLNQIHHCDYIFLTHGHYDHVLDAGKLAGRFSPAIYCSEVAARSLKKHLLVDPRLIRIVKAHDGIRLSKTAVDVVPGLHVDIAAEYKRLTHEDLDEPPDGEASLEVLKKTIRAIMGTDRLSSNISEWLRDFPQGAQLNYVISPPGRPVVYMAGTRPDPDIISEAENIKADITLLQVLAGHSLKGMERATVDLAVASGCRIAVPQHHDPLFEGAVRPDLTELKRLFSETKIVFQELVPGKWYEFDPESMHLLPV